MQYLWVYNVLKKEEGEEKYHKKRWGEDRKFEEGLRERKNQN
jgi:hypothetical protein